MIPLYDAGGSLLMWVAADFLDRHRCHLRIVINRRGHPTRAYLKPDSPMVEWLEATARRSSFGTGFQQHLPCGRTWALRGTAGSR